MANTSFFALYNQGIIPNGIIHKGIKSYCLKHKNLSMPLKTIYQRYIILNYHKKTGTGLLYTVSFAFLLAVRYYSNYACINFSISNFFIFKNASITFGLFTGSLISLPKTDGTICHDSPNLSLSQPH